MNPKGKVVWLTGLPGSGKTTLAEELNSRLSIGGVRCTILDGDDIREMESKDLGFSPSDRKLQAKRVASKAASLSSVGITVIVSLVSPYRSSRAHAKGVIGENRFIEVFVDCPLTVCQRRDPKGLYAKAFAGEVTNLTGVDAPYEEPLDPGVHVRTDISSVSECVGQIMDFYLTTC